MSFAEYAQRQHRDDACAAHAADVDALRASLTHRIGGRGGGGADGALPFKLVECDLFADDTRRLPCGARRRPCLSMMAFPHDDAAMCVEFAHTCVASAHFRAAVRQHIAADGAVATAAVVGALVVAAMRTIVASAAGRALLDDVVGLIYVACDEVPHVYVFGAERIKPLPAERNCVLHLRFVGATVARGGDGDDNDVCVEASDRRADDKIVSPPLPPPPSASSWWPPLTAAWEAVTHRWRHRSQHDVADAATTSTETNVAAQDGPRAHAPSVVDGHDGNGDDDDDDGHDVGASWLNARSCAVM